MKIRRLNQKRAKNKSKQRWLQQKVRICNSSTSYSYITIITSNPCRHWKLSLFKNENFTYELFNSCKHFIRLIGLSSARLKRHFEVAIFIFLKNKQGIYACVVLNFHPGLQEMSIIWKIWSLHLGLKFHLGLAKPSSNF